MTIKVKIHTTLKIWVKIWAREYIMMIIMIIINSKIDLKKFYQDKIQHYLNNNKIYLYMIIFKQQ
jgi:hypothetical protein